MAFVAGGTFQMGSDAVGSAGQPAQPVHSVTVAPFWMDSTEVTQADYQSLVGADPAEFYDDPDRPIEMVTWYDAVLYCNARSKRDGKDTVYSYTSVSGTARDGRNGLGNLAINFEANGYRLPTEAEWEYACCAGTTSEYYWGSDSANQYAWYSGNSSGTTHPVGTKLSNAWGLYDMCGNAWEWCNDWYGAYTSEAQTDPRGPNSGTVRVIRGGSWERNAAYLQSASRLSVYPVYLGYDVGFRACMSAR
jgi:formylglycine-generating enzyme required for sulfatase activity